VLYCEVRNQERTAAKQKAAEEASACAPQAILHVIDQGQRQPLELSRLEGLSTAACANLNADINAKPILAKTLRNLL